VLITPKEYYGAMMDLIKERRGSEIEVTYLEDDTQVMLTSLIPWQEVVCDMNDQVLIDIFKYFILFYFNKG
jgi:translation elongation factor EF-4